MVDGNVVIQDQAQKKNSCCFCNLGIFIWIALVYHSVVKNIKEPAGAGANRYW